MRHRRRSMRWFLAAFLVAAGITGVSRADEVGPLPATGTPEALGAEVYSHVCQECHMAQGQGAVGAGHYPRLVRDRALASWRYVALTVIGGRNGMPPFGLPAQQSGELRSTPLNDAQIAAVVNYVRGHFGNHFRGRVTLKQVAALRPTPASP